MSFRRPGTFCDNRGVCRHIWATFGASVGGIESQRNKETIDGTYPPHEDPHQDRPRRPGRRRGHHGKSGDRAEWLFERYDANQDGKITKEEITAARKASLTKYDANKDGQLSLEEFQGMFNEIMRHRMVRMFQKLDRDGDAKVSEAEIARRVDRMMAHLDRDDNGEIERGELKRKHKGHDRDRDERGHHGERR